MAKLYNITQHPKEKLKRNKARNKRFYSSLDMSIVKHDISVHNSRINRGELENNGNRYISECGCGSVGCFVHGTFKTVERQFYR